MGAGKDFDFNLTCICAIHALETHLGILPLSEILIPILYVPFMNTKNSLKSFSYRGAHLWNDLKPTSKNAPSLFPFKRTIKQYKQYKKATIFEPSIHIYLIFMSKTVYLFIFVF